VLNIDVRVKRDDLYPESGGGSKARKAAFIVGQAMQQGNKAIVSNGGLQSNHARAIALEAARHGLRCSLVLHTSTPDVPQRLAGNLMLMKLYGAELRFCRLNDLAEVMDTEMARLTQNGLNPLYVWGGGHCIQGALAYYEAAREARSQSGDWVPDYIVHASGTGTTQAGLMAGYADVGTQVIGISVARERARGERVVQEALSTLLDYLGCSQQGLRVWFRDEWTEGGYEHTSGRLLAAIDEAALHGLLLDPTYTGKAFLALRDMVRKQEIPPSSRVLFWHTGGLINLLTAQDYTQRFA
jgi:1-aminocyclopropane-1-carboxylate deaminase/D-cysteine desulfhydrase-like pyridoxal-dependent ACC family enzyme